MMKEDKNNLMDKIVSLAKRRGFVFPGSEIYGGLANTWDYGPLGVELKNNIKQLWWNRFVQQRDDMVGLDSAIIMNSKVWEASGHIKNFFDLLSECRKCHHRVRVDHFLGPEKMQEFGRKLQNADAGVRARVMEEIGAVLAATAACPSCGAKDWTEAKPFSGMFSTLFGPSGDEASRVYLRPETAQGIFANFKNVLGTTRRTLPFGIAQIGKAFRNEITPGNFILRTREFEQMEVEYFIRGDEWGKWFEYWRMEMRTWIGDIGIDLARIHEIDVPSEDRAHYSKRTIDFEYDFPNKSRNQRNNKYLRSGGGLHYLIGRTLFHRICICRGDKSTQCNSWRKSHYV